MENGTSIRRLCMIFGVMAIVLAGFMSAVSASDDQKDVTLWGLSEDLDSKIDPLLAQKMEETPSGEIPVIIEMKEQQKASSDLKSHWQHHWKKCRQGI